MLHVARLSARVRGNLVITASFSDAGPAFVCRTRDISHGGVFLDVDPSNVDMGSTITVSLLDPARGEVIDMVGEIVRVVEARPGQPGGIGVRLHHPPAQWQVLVERFGGRKRASTEPPPRRMRILVVGDEAHQRSAMALYVTSGFDVRFATGLLGLREALSGVRVDAVVVEQELEHPEVPALFDEVRRQQPSARRLLRTSLRGAALRSSTLGDLVHAVVDQDAGLDSFVSLLIDS
jgi:hypothetical protein